MKRKPSRSALVAVSLLCVMLLAACSSGGPILRNITIAPAAAQIDAGFTPTAPDTTTNSQQYSATGFYSDGSSHDVTATASWASSNSAVAAIGASTGLAVGGTPPDTTSVTITGSLGGQNAIATLTVYHPIQSIAISTTTPSIALGLTAQYKAIGTYLDLAGNTHTEDVTSVATWNSSAPTIATISSAGLANSVALGTTNITATIDLITSPISVLTVTGAVTTSLQVTPASPTLAVGTSVNLVALELQTTGKTVPLTGPVTWATSKCTPANAVIIAATGVNGTEAASGNLAGSCTVTATEGAFTGTSAVTVATGSAHFAYVADSGTPAGISGFTVTASSATPFVPLATTSVGGQVPTQAIVHPSGQYLYTVDSVSQVHLYTVSSGALTLPTEPSPLPKLGAGNEYNYGVIDPTGRFLFVTGNVGLTIDSAPLNPATGSVGTVSSYTNGAFTGPENAVVDHTGNYLYVIDDSGFVFGFTINQTNGTLTPLPAPGKWATGAGPLGLAIDPSNSWLYVANSDNTVSFYTIGAGGALTPGASLPAIASAAFLTNVVVDPSGKYLYVLDSGNSSANPAVNGGVYAFNLGANGAIGAEIGTASVATGLDPFGIIIDPTGTLLAVDNNSSNTISLFSVAAGVLTPTTPATVATGGQPLYVTFLNAAP